MHVVGESGVGMVGVELGGGCCVYLCYQRRSVVKDVWWQGEGIVLRERTAGEDLCG